MLLVGLTGGIASGKSTVCAIFQAAGAMIIDADIIAREVVAPGLPAWKEIKAVFGEQVLDSQGAIDRAKLGDIVFNDAQLRKQLERIIHPQVRAAMDREVTRLRNLRPDAVIIQDIPLLLETGMIQGMDEIIVVYAPPELQLQRLMQRDGIGPEAARARIDAQMPMEEKRRLATIVIDNSGDSAALEKETTKIYARLSRDAQKGT